MISNGKTDLHNAMKKTDFNMEITRLHNNKNIIISMLKFIT